MAKVKGQATGDKGRRNSSFRGRFYFAEFRGTPVVRKQTKVKKQKKSAKQIEAMETFKAACEIAKVCAPSQQRAAMVQARNTQYFPRDLLFMAMYGRTFWFQLQTGRKLFSMAANKSVSEVLDAIAQLPGSMMYRGPDGWVPLPLGAAGQVLTFFEGIPQWRTPTGGGGGGGGGGAGGIFFSELREAATPLDSGPDIELPLGVNQVEVLLALPQGAASVSGMTFNDDDGARYTYRRTATYGATTFNTVANTGVTRIVNWYSSGALTSEFPQLTFFRVTQAVPDGPVHVLSTALAGADQYTVASGYYSNPAGLPLAKINLRAAIGDPWPAGAFVQASTIQAYEAE